MDISNLIDFDKKEKELFDNIDKKVSLKFEKQKKTNRTMINGLHYFLNPEEIKSFGNKIKKRLGTGCIEKILDDGYIEIGFNGNHILILKKILMEDLKIEKDRIKC
jgi:hypothetical protein